jgi:diamine N-acetyltransferase
MTEVHLRPITKENLDECLRLELDERQAGLVASNVTSLAQAYTDANLTPLAIYDAAARGYEGKAPVPMVGFTMYEVAAGVGFVLRLMIDRRYQRKGYGSAAVREVIRRVRLDPRVELVATSHRRENQPAASLFHSLGFVPWEIEWARAQEAETFLWLPHQAPSLALAKG